MSRKKQKVEIYREKEGSGLAFFSTDLGHICESNIGKELGVLLREKDFKSQILMTTLSAYTLSWYTQTWLSTILLATTKAPLLRCFFFSKLKSGDLLSTGHYMNYQTFSKLQVRPVFKNVFHSIHIGLKDSSVEKILFVSVSIARLVLLFRKASNPHF